jgi:hypothetical protein
VWYIHAFETEAERGKPGEALAQPWVRQQTFGTDHRRSPGRLCGMRGGDEADDAEAAAERLDHRLQRLFDRCAERQVRVADHTGADPRLAVDAARRHRSDAVGEFDLADRTQLDVGVDDRQVGSMISSRRPGRCGLLQCSAMVFALVCSQENGSYV